MKYAIVWVDAVWDNLFRSIDYLTLADHIRILWEWRRVNRIICVVNLIMDSLQVYRAVSGIYIDL